MGRIHQAVKQLSGKEKNSSFVPWPGEPLFCYGMKMLWSEKRN